MAPQCQGTCVVMRQPLGPTSVVVSSLWKNYVFCCPRQRLSPKGSLPFDLTLSHVLSLKSVKEVGNIARTAKALLALDHPPLVYKVACCLYAVGQGGPLKVLADACSVGVSTLRTWLQLFAEGVMKYVKPVYMPAKPMDPQTRNHVEQQFASRRGIPDCVLACDGTHVPFHPKNKKTAKE